MAGHSGKEGPSRERLVKEIASVPRFLASSLSFPLLTSRSPRLMTGQWRYAVLPTCTVTFSPPPPPSEKANGRWSVERARDEKAAVENEEPYSTVLSRRARRKRFLVTVTSPFTKYFPGISFIKCPIEPWLRLIHHRRRKMLHISVIDSQYSQSCDYQCGNN